MKFLTAFLFAVALSTTAQAGTWLQCMQALVVAAGTAEKQSSDRYMALTDAISENIRGYWDATDHAEWLEQLAGSGDDSWTACNAATMEARECLWRQEDLTRRARLALSNLGDDLGVTKALTTALLPPGATPYALLTTQRRGFRLVLPATTDHRNPRPVHLFFLPPSTADVNGDEISTYRINIAVSNRDEATEIVERLYDLIIGGRHRANLGTTPVNVIFPLVGTYRGLSVISAGRPGGGTLSLSFKPRRTFTHDTLRLVYHLMVLTGLMPERGP